MSKMLYLMHVPWSWIKQRPHFLAEGLSSNFDLSIVTEDRIPFRERFLQQKQAKNFRYLSLKFADVKFVNQLSFILKRQHLRWLCKRHDILWISFPNQIAYFDSKSLDGKNVIYDCMDDAPLFYQGNERKILFELEARLCKRADIIFVSSKNLHEKIKKRYNRDAVLINNAIRKLDFDNKLELNQELKSKFESRSKAILYLGTISSWFDFDVLTKALEEVENICFYLVGPKDVEIPEHKSITWIPPVSHDMVFPLMEKADTLIMPFVLNEIVLGVNPVKAYEYIYSGKPVILPHYGESEYFEDYVYLYHDFSEFRNLISDVAKGRLKPKKTKEDCFQFVQNNTWEKRVGKIMEVIDAK